jgi:hypothetical protein
MYKLNNYTGFMKPVGVTVVDGGGNSGCCYMLKKKPWLRVFHALMLHDTSEFLLDIFGKPVSFNRVGVDDKHPHGLFEVCKRGYRHSLSNDDARVRINVTASLSKLCLCPWIYDKNTPVELDVGRQYRLGYEKIKSTIEGGFNLMS